MCLGILGLVAVNNPVTFVMVVPVIVAFVILRNYFMKSSREVKRIEGISKKNPLVTVRFCGLSTLFAKPFFILLDQF